MIREVIVVRVLRSKLHVLRLEINPVKHVIPAIFVDSIVFGFNRVKRVPVEPVRDNHIDNSIKVLYRAVIVPLWEPICGKIFVRSEPNLETVEVVQPVTKPNFDPTSQPSTVQEFNRNS